MLLLLVEYLHLESENCKVFHFELLSAKTNVKILLKLKKTPFWILFAHFKSNQNFSEKLDFNLVLGPLLFLIYINDLPQGSRAGIEQFTDDTMLFPVVMTLMSIYLNWIKN